MTRILLSALAAAIAWFAGIVLFFGPLQGVLANPELQSGKMLGAFTGSPPPRASETPWILVPGLAAIGLGVALAYRLVRAAFHGSRWARGRSYGLVLWLAGIPWFEFYLPFNVLREPLPLATLEALCWLLTLQLVGHAVVFAAGTRRTTMP